MAVAVARGWAAVEAGAVRAWAAAVTSAANSEAGAAGVEGERGVAVRAVVARAVSRSRGCFSQIRMAVPHRAATVE